MASDGGLRASARVAAEPSRGDTPARRSAGTVWRSLVALAVLAPLIALFAQVWRANSAGLSFAAKERHGIEYVEKLSTLATALTDAQSAAVARRSVPGDPLAAAVNALATVDSRLGAELRTTERWSGLRSKIEALPQRSFPTPAAAQAAYAEAGDLLLDLYTKVRDTSNLVRDPDADAYYLQDAIADKLPESVVASANLVGAATVAATRPADELMATFTDLATAQSAVRGPAGELTDDLQSALDRTGSGTLSGNLLTPLDRYQRGIDGLVQATGTRSQTAYEVDAAAIGKARDEVQAAAIELSQAVLTELRALIADRESGLNSTRTQAVAALAGGAVLALIPLVFLAVSRRRPAPVPPAAPLARRTSGQVGGTPAEEEPVLPWRERARAAR